MEKKEIIKIEDCILTIRGQHVMLDRDLARLYGVETKVLNQAVKRNMERFPKDFMFQLTDEECLRCQIGTLSEANNLKSQIVISNSVSDSDTYDDKQRSRSQIVTLNKGRGSNIKYAPYAFTENGIAMLSGVLRSPTAIAVNIQIMRAFNAMRQFLMSNAQFYQRVENLEHHQLELMKRQDIAEQRQAETSSRVNELFSKLDVNMVNLNQKIYFDGKVYDAYTFVAGLIRKAEKNIVLIDNYIDDSVLTILDKRSAGVGATVYTAKISKHLRLDIDKHNAQYPPIDVRIYTKSHDRFLCIDEAVYHIGASIKDLGKKWFAFSRLNDISTSEILTKISS